MPHRAGRTPESDSQQGDNTSNLEHTPFSARIERKFYFPPGRVDLAYATLRHVCRNDSDYPEGRVSSLYFDTVELDCYSASGAGEWERHKVRLRWYGKIDSVPSAVVFLERKTKQGFSTTRQRRTFSVAAERLSPGRLHEGAIDRRAFVDALTEMGHREAARLRPILAVTYRRRRLVDMLSGVRISLDSEITSTLVSRETSAGAFDVRLPGAVVEVKGSDMALPPSLRQMRLLDAGWGRFSKYCQCLGAHLFETEPVGGRWPSGLCAGP